jgi:hypothetical protein
MKVTRETFYFHNKKKSRRGKILKVSKLSGKRTVAGQNSGEFRLLGWDEQCVKPLSSSFEGTLNQAANVIQTLRSKMSDVHGIKSVLSPMVFNSVK